MSSLENIKKENIKRAVAVGYFDGVHIGHKKVIGEMVEFAVQNNLTPTILTFNFEKLRPELKGKIDLISKQKRNKIFKQLSVEQHIEIDFTKVTDMTEQAFFDTFLCEKGLCAKAVFVGDDFRFGKNRCGDIKSLEQLANKKDIKVFGVEQVKIYGKSVSTTRIKTALEQGDVKLANDMLGYNFGFCETVVEGKKLGSKLGFATANQHLGKATTIPKYGVYLSRVFVDGEWRKAITNIGTRPTYHETANVTAETHILDFNRELYKEKLEVELLDFIREEKKFDTAEQLKQEVLKNIVTARETEI